MGSLLVAAAGDCCLGELYPQGLRVGLSRLQIRPVMSINIDLVNNTLCGLVSVPDEPKLGRPEVMVTVV